MLSYCTGNRGDERKQKQKKYRREIKKRARRRDEGNKNPRNKEEQEEKDKESASRAAALSSKSGSSRRLLCGSRSHTDKTPGSRWSAKQRFLLIALPPGFFAVCSFRARYRAISLETDAARGERLERISSERRHANGRNSTEGPDPSAKLCPLFPREKVDGTRLAFAVTVTRCPPRYPDLSCLDHVFSGCSIVEDKGRITWSPGAREKGN